MMRITLPLLLLALAACSPTVPDSGAGVGFGDYDSFETARIERERLLRAETPVVPGQRSLSDETIANVDPSIGAAPAGGAPLSALQPQAEAPVTTNNPGISDEQDFAAVSARETIESDAERLARLREEYKVIQPEALPTRSGSGGPNIVEFALSTTNRVGQSIYRRSGFNAENRFNRACARYATADQAQLDFLSRGGPENDRLGVDPDGDGFACYWDPAPFRTARGG